jgi:hypothetical protein
MLSNCLCTNPNIKEDKSVKKLSFLVWQLKGEATNGDHSREGGGGRTGRLGTFGSETRGESKPGRTFSSSANLTAKTSSNIYTRCVQNQMRRAK